MEKERADSSERKILKKGGGMGVSPECNTYTCEIVRNKT